MAKHSKLVLILCVMVASVVEVAIWGWLWSYFFNPAPTPAGQVVPAAIVGSNIVIAMVLGSKRKVRSLFVGVLIAVALVGITAAVQSVVDTHERKAAQERRVDALAGVPVPLGSKVAYDNPGEVKLWLTRGTPDQLCEMYRGNKKGAEVRPNNSEGLDVRCLVPFESSVGSVGLAGIVLTPESAARRFPMAQPSPDDRGAIRVVAYELRPG